MHTHSGVERWTGGRRSGRIEGGRKHAVANDGGRRRRISVRSLKSYGKVKFGLDPPRSVCIEKVRFRWFPRCPTRPRRRLVSKEEGPARSAASQVREARR